MPEIRACRRDNLSPSLPIYLFTRRSKRKRAFNTTSCGSSDGFSGISASSSKLGKFAGAKGACRSASRRLVRRCKSELQCGPDCLETDGSFIDIAVFNSSARSLLSFLSPLSTTYHAGDDQTAFFSASRPADYRPSLHRRDRWAE